MIQKILNYLKKLIPIDLDSMVLESSENESNVYQKYGVAAAAGTAVALFSLLIFRIIFQAEKQTNKFRRIYSYGVAGLIFTHFFINIGMSLGLVPTIGIPLPFISYGGSSLITFSLMLFIYLNFD